MVAVCQTEGMKEMKQHLHVLRSPGMQVQHVYAIWLLLELCGQLHAEAVCNVNIAFNAKSDVTCEVACAQYSAGNA